jgi:transcriptional regulator with XRE-family HTH domain
MKMTNYIASNLRFLRKESGMSQTELAAKLGLSRSNIASYESGAAEPNANRLKRIAHFFDVSMEVLIGADLQADPAQLRVSEEGQLSSYANDIASFVRKTTEMRRIYEGLKEFYNYRKPRYTQGSEELQGLVTEFEKLSEIMEHLLEVNEGLTARLASSTGDAALEG